MDLNVFNSLPDNLSCWARGFWCAVVLLGLGICVRPLGADDTHYQDFVIGGRAIGLGGAFTAISNDPSGVYYNPAGLSDTTQANVQVSTSLYGFEKGSIGNKLGLPVPGLEDLDINFTELIIIPASGGFIGTIGKPDEDGHYKHAYGVEVSVPSFRSYSAKNETMDGDGTLTSYSRRVTDRSLWSGVGYSYRVLPRLQIGASAFYVLRSVVDVEDVSVAVPVDQEQHAFSTGRNDLSFLSGNLIFGLGLRLVLPGFGRGKWMVGLMLRSPSIRLHTDGSMLYTRGRSDPTAAEGNRSFFDRHSISEIEASSAHGFSGRAGIAYMDYKSFTLSADVSFHAPVNYKKVNINDPEILATLPFDTNVTRQAVFNFNVGSEFLIIPEVSIAAGLFSDFSSAPPIPDSPQKGYLPRINLIGITAALGYFGDYTLTRLGVIYSAGRGSGVMPVDDTERLLDKQQSFVKVDQVLQSFMYIYVSSSFRY